MRCYFCGRTDFNHLDDISLHLATVTAEGKNLCTGITDSIDPHGTQELFPQKILGRKYAPKRPPKKEDGMSDGVYCCYTNEGIIAKDGKNKEISLVSHIIHLPYDENI